MNFIKSRRQRIADSWLQRRDPWFWTSYSNVDNVLKKIDHIFVSTRLKIVHNIKIYLSAELFATDQTC